MQVRIDYKNIFNAAPKDAIKNLKEQTLKAYHTLVNKNGAGSDFLGWIDYPINYDKNEYERIKKAALKIQNDSSVLVVIGIGGSYLGAKAVIEALKDYFPLKKKLEIIFAGNNLSSTYMSQLLKYLEDKSFSINVISKSGTTTEPAIAFRLLKELLIKKVGEEETAKRIYATTDKAKGALRELSTKCGYETFIVPDDIGGRYSWFTAVGLLPIAAAGIDIDALMEGARLARKECLEKEYEENSSLLYAACRTALSMQNKDVEILVSYEPKLKYISEWWKQLYGESEGKDNKGIFPASLVYSTDLHSMGQYVQEGKRIMFETVLNVVNPSENITLTKEENNLDQLNYLDGKTLDSVCKKAFEGTLIAHVDGNVPNIVLSIDKIDEKNIGYLLYFFMFSCGVCCYMTGVNPFNQPGVESYKKNMFALLEKPGYEKMTEEIKKRL